MTALKNRNEQLDQIARQGGPGATIRIRPDEAFSSVFAPPEKEVLYYDLAEFAVNSLQQQRLQAIVSLMEENPSMGLLISGHADAIGDSGNNLRLSRLRAEAAAQYILRQSGFDPGRIITRFYGEAVPPSFTGAPGGSSGAERRVELDFIKIK
jgi:outer membrane protein OmpA-like peptidoglycan-associated protein